PRIKREDGLIRIVPGLGTRAVDRIGNDYPVLIAPGKPELRVNLSLKDFLAYSPRNIDVINIETNTFETIPIKKLIEEVGNDYPAINDIFSIIEEKHLKVPVGLGIDTKKHEIIPTFDNLINKTDYIKKINEILSLLRNTIGTPVDIEFASDGESLYLLQCRPQSYYSESASAVIPKDIPNDKIIFTAKKHVSGGRIPDANYIVYIDPQHYVNLSTYEDYKNIGRAVGKLNYLLTKKTFILLGPGRWGSRDDFKMGVSVSYSDICNTSLLVEIARKKGNYVPDLSFGTHFFQDLVESSIYYLPLYPDEDNVVFNQDFFDNSPNTLNRFIPEFEQYSSVIKVINVPEATGGDICRILMDSDNDEAICFLTNKQNESTYKTISVMNKASDNVYAMNWRLEMVNVIAMKIDRKRFGVKNLYLFGTTFLGTAGANSDIDILVHFDGNEEQRKELQLWFDGWNLALSEINFQNSGYRVEKFIDAYIVTDKDIAEKEYYAHLIDEKANASKKL
ncbi:MAG TPA: PEP/pyruvate-binding domain-containing protein, partial [Candidatus Kapabacteria bacterium]|nr:PEP/pyruvate-binding domain-containing protein [Candidatus Kapabacteria bacterium]